MGIATTVVLVFLSLAGLLAMGWWAKSVLAVLALYALLGLGVALFYAEKSAHPYTWRAHMIYWALSIITVTLVYMMTKAGGWFLFLLIVNVIALSRALSRLDAQSAGITYPLNYEGPSAKDLGAKDATPKKEPDYEYVSHSKVGPQPRSENIIATANGHSVILEDRPEVQVELETYKEGENAVPIVRTGSRSAGSRYNNDIDSLMRKVTAELNHGSKKRSVANKVARRRGRPKQIGRPKKVGRPRKPGRPRKR